MGKKAWRFTFSILLSIILFLLLAITIHIDKNGNKNNISREANKMSDQTFMMENVTKLQDNMSHKNPVLYEIFTKKSEDVLLFEKFTKKEKTLAEKEDTPRIAFIIDDLGYQTEIAKRILELGYPVTFSILPYLHYSQDVFQMAKENGMTVLMHLPMEPNDPNVNPGEGAIYSTMSDNEIKNKLISNFQELPGVDGINNHMGSKITENSKIMTIILSEINSRGLFFIDSMTSPDSVGYRLSKQMGIRTAYRSVFLDNNQDIDYIRGQIDLLKEVAQKYGSAIAIGHPYCATIDVLQETGLTLQAEGFKIVKLQELLE